MLNMMEYMWPIYVTYIYVTYHTKSVCVRSTFHPELSPQTGWKSAFGLLCCVIYDMVVTDKRKSQQQLTTQSALSSVIGRLCFLQLPSSKVYNAPLTRLGACVMQCVVEPVLQLWRNAHSAGRRWRLRFRRILTRSNLAGGYQRAEAGFLLWLYLYYDSISTI